jgi:PAS domain S-box-containing protein
MNATGRYLLQARARMATLQEQAAQPPADIQGFARTVLDELALALVMVEAGEQERHSAVAVPASAADAWLEVLQQLSFQEAVLARVPGVIMILEGNGRIRYSSPSVESTLGFSPDTLLGRDAFDMLHPSDRPELRSRLDGLGAQQIMPPLQVRLKCRDGSWAPAEIGARNACDDRLLHGIVMEVQVREG